MILAIPHLLFYLLLAHRDENMKTYFGIKNITAVQDGLFYNSGQQSMSV